MLVPLSPAVVFISLEFLPPLFSGNGVYSRSLVSATAAAGSQVLVISGTPPPAENSSPLAPPVIEDDSTHLAGAAAVIGIPLERWGTIDESSDHIGFAVGASSDHVLGSLASFAPAAALFVDWSGAAAWRSIRSAAARSSVPAVRALSRIPSIYLSFRVFSTSRGLHHTEKHAAFYRCAEAAAVVDAHISVALCRSDAAMLSALALGVDPLSGAEFDAANGHLRVHKEVETAAAVSPAAPITAAAATAVAPPLPRMFVLLPPLRRDIEVLARGLSLRSSAPVDTANKNSSASTPAASHTSSTPIDAANIDDGAVPPPRNTLTSIVRLSPEKGPHRFAELVGGLARSGTLREANIRTLLGGAIGDTPYADAVIVGLSAACSSAGAPLTVESSFLGPAQLRELFSRTVLNVHPALADAYGMTIVEAAAFGVPSLVNIPGAAVGSSLSCNVDDPAAETAKNFTTRGGTVAEAAENSSAIRGAAAETAENSTIHRGAVAETAGGSSSSHSGAAASPEVHEATTETATLGSNAVPPRPAASSHRMSTLGAAAPPPITYVDAMRGRPSVFWGCQPVLSAAATQGIPPAATVTQGCQEAPAAAAVAASQGIQPLVPDRSAASDHVLLPPSATGFLRLVWSGRSLEEDCEASAERVRGDSTVRNNCTDLTTAERVLLGRRILGMRFPPVGACDLLAPEATSVFGAAPTAVDSITPPSAPHVVSSVADSLVGAPPCGAIIAADLRCLDGPPSEPSESLVRYIGSLLRESHASPASTLEPRTLSDPASTLARVGAQARALALGWTETHSSNAIRALLREVLTLPVPQQSEESETDVRV